MGDGGLGVSEIRSLGLVGLGGDGVIGPGVMVRSYLVLLIVHHLKSHQISSVN